MNWHQHLKSNGGELSFQLWIEEILKYAIALFLILYVDEIFDALSWLFNVIIKLVAKNATDPFSSEAPDLKGVNAIVKAMLQFILLDCRFYRSDLD